MVLQWWNTLNVVAEFPLPRWCIVATRICTAQVGPLLRDSIDLKPSSAW